ncbi:hypothetical protein [Bacteroides sp. 519]|uniref:HU family DNA-binding protein n=1 Tax=Bacteroides sp. 519 TaxID=2302937 RepID=UPI00351A6615|nr:hypothetical protein [Bacteroides sp. 519]
MYMPCLSSRTALRHFNIWLLNILGILIRRMRFYLTKGNKVKIGGLGTFHLTFHNKGTEEENHFAVLGKNPLQDCTIRFKVTTKEIKKRLNPKRGVQPKFLAQRKVYRTAIFFL